MPQQPADDVHAVPLGEDREGGWRVWKLTVG